MKPTLLPARGHVTVYRYVFFNDVTFLQLKNSNFSGFHLAQKLLFVTGIAFYSPWCCL
jgi:hypothetical protein